VSSFHVWLPLVVALVLNAAANVLIKVGAKLAAPLGTTAPFLDKVLNFLNAATIAGIVLFAANVLVYRKALDNLDISVAYPIMVSVGLILVTIASVTLPVLSERVSAVQIAGMVLISIGVWLVARGQ
jgi:multidrug transporter EmrE-like cation transporter